MNLVFLDPCFRNQCRPAAFMENQIRQFLEGQFRLPGQQVTSRQLYLDRHALARVKQKILMAPVVFF